MSLNWCWNNDLAYDHAYLPYNWNVNCKSFIDIDSQRSMVTLNRIYSVSHLTTKLDDDKKNCQKKKKKIIFMI